MKKMILIIPMVIFIGIFIYTLLVQQQKSSENADLNINSMFIQSETTDTKTVFNGVEFNPKNAVTYLSEKYGIAEKEEINHEFIETTGINTDNIISFYGEKEKEDINSTLYLVLEIKKGKRDELISNIKMWENARLMAYQGNFTNETLRIENSFIYYNDNFIIYICLNDLSYVENYDRAYEKISKDFNEYFENQEKFEVIKYNAE